MLIKNFLFLHSILIYFEPFLNASYPHNISSIHYHSCFTIVWFISNGCFLVYKNIVKSAFFGVDNLLKKILPSTSLSFISERRRETRRVASLRSMQRASCYSHKGGQNNFLTCEILILAMWFMD